MVKITDKQATILGKVAEYTSPPSARRLTDNLQRPGFRSAHWTYDQVYASCMRMVKRGWLERLPGQAGEQAHRFRVTPAGTAALAEYAAGAPD